MRINKITLQNINNIEHEEWLPGDVNVLEGPNGSGKSLRMKAIRSCLTVPGRGKDYTGLLNDEHSFGSASLVTANMTIVRHLSPANSPLSIRGKKIGELSGPEADRHIKNAFDVESINAESFLVKDKKERTRLILEAIPFQIDNTELQQIVPEESIPDGHPLEVVEAVHKRIYDKRTEVNREEKEKRFSAKQLFDTQPPELELEGCDREIAEIEQSIAIATSGHDEALETARITMERDIETKRASGNAATEESYRKTQESIEQLQHQIDALKKSHTDFSGSQMRLFATFKESWSSTHDDLRSRLDAELSDATDALAARLSDVRNKRDKELSARSVRAIAASYEKEAEHLQKASAELSVTLVSLDSFKRNMLKELPIPGIELHDGDVMIDGKRWDAVPESRLCILAIDLAIARSQDSGVLMVDGCDKLDDENFERVIEHLRGCGRQSFVARWKSGIPFGVRTLSKT